MKNIKHAYLIIAHKSDLTFQTLLKMLDDERNDIYIHMDSKNKFYNQEVTEALVTKSQLMHTERTNVSWGGYSQINAELLLLKQASYNGTYAYYHLLSGEDLPIKSQDQIHDFFERNQGLEFVQFQESDFKYDKRVKYRYFLQDKIGRVKDYEHDIFKRRYLLSVFNYVFVKMQKIFRMERNKGVRFQKGANWFSITDELANFVVSKERWIRKIFRYTYCCDEVFLQTIVVNSSFKDNLYYKKFNDDYEAIMRLIDWKRGKPYVFKKEDYHELCESNMLFARKFDASVDEVIIKNIYRKMKG